MNQHKRRKFLSYLAAVPFIGSAFSCDEKPIKKTKVEEVHLVKKPEAMELSRSMKKDQVFAMLDQRVSFIMLKSHNCAQSAFYSLSEQFGLGGNEILKALTPLPGLAERGQTCGAITGTLMAMGLIYGKDRLDDWDTYRSSLTPTNKFCRRFEEEMGTTQCCQIQERAFGRSFNLMDPEELKEFQRAGATSKCSTVVQKACRLAAEIILEHNKA
ncbi:MAG: C-GCAxxG-C-C family protein [Cytophagales bacterium]|nr:C-GCAxxG-C-C family protein [Cytophagales bacterium]